MGGRAAGGRRKRRERGKRPSAPPYVKRQIPFFPFADEEALVRLEDQADWLIQEIGLEFRDDEEALRIWRAAGADVEGTRVKAPRGMIRELCRTAPSEFTQLARNPERSVRIGGAMGPVTTAACIAQALAEAMMCCAFTQLVRPGAPFILGNFLSSMSLKSGAPTFGMPEPVMSNFIIGQLARRLGIPLRCGGALTASKVADAQAAYESADSMLSTVLGGANYVLHAAGWLEGGLCTGYEKLLLDADRLGAYQVLLSGMPVDDDALARDAYEEVEPSGHFLGCAHTLRNYETAFYDAVMSDSENVESWEERGAKDAQQRAFERWQQMLQDYEAPPIDPAVDEALRDFVARRKDDLPDAWY